MMQTQSAPRIELGLPGLKVDPDKPGLHIVDPASFESALSTAFLLRSTGNDVPVFGRHFYTRSYYFCRQAGSLTRYALCTEMGGSGEVLNLPDNLVEDLRERLGMVAGSPDGLVSVRMALLFKRFSPNALGEPCLLSLCNAEMVTQIDQVVPDLSGPLSPNVFRKNHLSFTQGPEWF